MNDIFFKYRPLGGKKELERVLEIIWKAELHASEFTAFNDVNEGFFYIDNSIIKQAEEINKQKLDERICSFSNKDEITHKDDLLLWAHYANGHKGVRIEFELANTNNAKLYSVKYNETPMTINSDITTTQDIQNILLRKNSAWEYEREYRTFSKADKIKIKIKNIVFGVGLFDKKSRIAGNEIKFDKKYKTDIIAIYCVAKSKNIDVYKYKNFYHSEQEFISDKYLVKIEKDDELIF